MRFFEFDTANAGIDKFIIALRNHIGRAASKRSASTLNWNALSQLSRANGFEFDINYDTFKSMYNSNPALQNMVSRYDASGIELNVPGSPSDIQSDGTQDSEEEVGKIADQNVDNQLDQYSKGIQA